MKGFVNSCLLTVVASSTAFIAAAPSYAQSASRSANSAFFCPSAQSSGDPYGGSGYNPYQSYGYSPYSYGSYGSSYGSRYRYGGPVSDASAGCGTFTAFEAAIDRLGKAVSTIAHDNLNQVVVAAQTAGQQDSLRNQFGQVFSNQQTYLVDFFKSPTNLPRQKTLEAVIAAASGSGAAAWGYSPTVLSMITLPSLQPAVDRLLNGLTAEQASVITDWLLGLDSRVAFLSAIVDPSAMVYNGYGYSDPNANSVDTAAVDAFLLNLTSNGRDNFAAIIKPSATYVAGMRKILQSLSGYRPGAGLEKLAALINTIVPPSTATDPSLKQQDQLNRSARLSRFADLITSYYFSGVISDPNLSIASVPGLASVLPLNSSLYPSAIFSTVPSSVAYDPKLRGAWIGKLAIVFDYAGQRALDRDDKTGVPAIIRNFAESSSWTVSIGAWFFGAMINTISSPEALRSFIRNAPSCMPFYPRLGTPFSFSGPFNYNFIWNPSKQASVAAAFLTNDPVAIARACSDIPVM